MNADFWMATTAVLVPLVLIASWIDFADRKVPNVVNLTLLLLGLSAQLIWRGSGGLLDGLLGMVVGFVPLVLAWLAHAMGAGDVKLMTAIGAWMGWELTLVSLLIGVLLGGVIGVIMIVSGKKTDDAIVNLWTIASKFSNRKTAFSDFGSVESFGTTTQKLPYGVPLTIGTLIVLVFESSAVPYVAPWQ